LNVFGNCSFSIWSGFHTVNVRPSAVHDTMWSVDGSETRFHVFLRISRPSVKNVSRSADARAMGDKKNAESE
jgi:hypothetical protein